MQLTQPIAPPQDQRAPEDLGQIGRIAIPKIGLDAPLHEGIRLTTLDRGPGHWPGSAMPGQVGNVVVAGHRTSHDADFRHIDDLVPGDVVTFTTADGVFDYAVTGTEIVSPDALWIIDPSDTADRHPVRLSPARVDAPADRRPPRTRLTRRAVRARRYGVAAMTDATMPDAVLHDAAAGRPPRSARAPLHARIARPALALGAGALVALAMPPWGFWPLAVVGVMLFEIALGAEPSRRQRFLLGYLFGAGWMYLGMGWMIQLTLPGYIIAGSVYALLPRGRRADRCRTDRGG